MEELVDQYIQIRDFLSAKVEEMCQVFLTGIWDPLIKHSIIKEVKNLVIKELVYEFPDFPVDYLPNIKIKIDEQNLYVEVAVQLYLNKITDLNFLGNIEYGGIDYDLYCRKSWDPYFSYVFYARHGHEDSLFEKGSKEPAAQYMAGIMTPLSIAYSFAIDEGYIN